MRNSTQLDNTEWQQTDEGWQTEFACPVVYLGDRSWIAYDCPERTEFFLNGEFLGTREKGSGHIPLDNILRPGRNCLETRTVHGHPDISLLVTGKSHFRVHESDEPSLGCSCSWVPGSGILKVQAQLMETNPGDTLRLILRDPDGRILDEVEVNADRQEPVDLVTDQSVLWQGVENPALLELVAQLKRRGTVKDEIRMHTGMRTYSLDAAGAFLLNGRPYPIRGRIVTGTEDGGRLASLVKEGYTAVWDRSGQSAAWLLEDCDRLGLVVFATMDDHARQKLAAQGHVSLCFWIQEPGKPGGMDVTRLNLDASLLETENEDFTLHSLLSR